MASYSGDMAITCDFINYLYNNQNFSQSKHLNNEEVIKICDNIGIFKLKGYIKEIRYLNDKNIDDVLFIYFFDKYFAKILFDLTIRIESKLKSILINECYALTKNHFFYLEQRNHKWNNYKIDFATIKNWEVQIQSIDSNISEEYKHYILFYLQNYDFISNKKSYLDNRELITNIDENRYNYPPFKYLIESATLGSIISFIQSLKINNQNIDKKVSYHFGIGQPSIFNNYLKRLNEIRNRVAHGGRIFNRTFRSTKGIRKFQSFRKNINNHKSLDVYLFLYYMLNKLESYNNFEDFKAKELSRLFVEFKKDKVSNDESFQLIEKYNQKDITIIKEIIIKKMSQ